MTNRMIIANRDCKLDPTHDWTVMEGAKAAWHEGVQAFVFHGKDIVADNPDDAYEPRDGARRGFVTMQQAQDAGDMVRWTDIQVVGMGDMPRPKKAKKV